MALAAEPAVLAVEVTVLGVDEAGRGAVLGPLVVAGVCVEEGRLAELWRLGAQDSKLVPRERRRHVVRAIAKLGVRARAVVIPAAAVDRQNLTTLEREAIVKIIAVLSPDQVVVDTPVGPSAIPQFRDSLSSQTGLARDAISVAPQADRDHPAVAAASLVAKVVRDGYVLALRHSFGDFGWGYPGEPRVQAYLAAWLAEHGSLPSICRTRWKPVRILAAPSSPSGERAG